MRRRLRQQQAVRAATMVVVGTALGVAALAALSLGLLVATGVDLGGDLDHAPMEGTDGLEPHELGELKTPPTGQPRP
jgi:hypothetical protein